MLSEANLALMRDLIALGPYSPSTQNHSASKVGWGRW